MAALLDTPIADIPEEIAIPQIVAAIFRDNPLLIPTRHARDNAWVLAEKIYAAATSQKTALSLAHAA